MNYQDGYSQKALDALAKGKYKSFRSSGLAHTRYTEGKKKRDNAVAKQNKTQNPTPRNTNAMANDPGFFAPSVSLPVPTLPMVNAMQGDPRFQRQPEYNGDEVLNQLLGGVKSPVKDSPNLSDMIPKTPRKSNTKRSKAKPSTRYTNETEKDFLGGLMAEYADEHPFISTLNSLALNAGSTVEGIENALSGFLGESLFDPEKPVSDLYARRGLTKDSLAATKAKEGIRQTVQDNIDNGFGKFAYNTGTGLADMGINMAISGGNPVAMGVVSGAQNAAQNTLHARERGVDADKARKTGLATGVVAGVMNSVGLDSVLKSTAKTVAGQVLQGAGKEGLENVVEDIADIWIDNIINGDNSETSKTIQYYVQNGMSEEEAYKKSFVDYLNQELVSFASGAALGGAIGGAKKLPQLGAYVEGKLAERDARKNPTVAGILDGTITESPRVPDVVEQAMAQAEIERLNEQLPEMPESTSNVNTMQNVDFKPSIHNADGQLLDTVKVPEYTADSNVFFNGSDSDIAFAEAQDAAITDTFRNIVSDPEFNALSFKNGRQEVYVSPSTNGEGYRVSYTVDGVPTGHHDYSINEIDDLSQNLREMAGNGGEDIRIQKKSDLARQTDGRSFTDMSPEEQSALQADLDSEYNFDVNEVAANDTGIESNPTITERYPFPEKADGSRPDYHNVEEVGTRLETTRQSIAKNNEDIETLNKQLNDIPDLKKNAKERSALKNQIYQLEQQNKQSAKLEKILTKISDGEKVSNKDIFEVEFPDDYNAIFDGRGGFFGRVNMATKFAGDTPEAKALAQSIRDDIYSIAKGDFDIENLGGLLEKVYNLDRMAQETKADYRARGTGKNPSRVYKYDDFFAGTKNGIGDDFTDHVIHSLDKAYQIANNMTDIDTTSRVAEAAGESAPVETPESVVAELNQTPVEATNDTGIDNRVPTVTEGNVPPSNVPPTNNGGETGISKLVTNSARNADIVSEYEYENDPVVQNIAKYAKHNNETTFNNALDNVKQNGGKLLEEYNNGARKIDNDQDVDQSMLILQGLTERMRAGEDVSAQRNLLLSKLRQAATTWGQNIQAFAKWNDTADGALINGDRILSGREADWESRNQKQADRNKKVAEDLSKIPTAEYDGTKIDNGTGYKVPKVNPNQTNAKLNNALKKQGYDGTMDIPKEPKTREQLRKEVVNSLKREYGSVENQFTDQDIDYITNLINEGATTDELANALNTKMATGAFGISADTQNKVNLLFDEASKYDPNSVDANRAKAAAYKLIADEVVGKATPYEKFEAWRYIAMLGNPKTMFRNFVGNTTFNVVTSVSNGLSGALEAAVDYPIRAGKWASNKLFKTDFDTSKGIERTKSLAAVIPTKKNASLVKASWDDAYEHRYNEMSGQKYEKGVQDKIRDSKSVFNSKWAKLYEKLTDAGISDTFAVRTKYSTSLAGYLRANGIDDGIFEADKRFRKIEDASRQRALTDSERADLDSLRSDHEKLEKARDYAVKEAEYATFHEDNKVAQLLSEFSTKARNSDNVVAKGIGYIFEGVMPFKKTPSNIVRSGYDFSPFGAISSIKKTGKLIYENTGGRRGNLADTYKTKSGKEVNKTLASDVIESWARNLTGTGMMMLGYYLTSKGILNSSKKDELYQDELEGKQNYSITINGHTYTIDWAAPASMSLLMGAELHKIVERNAIPGKKVYENVGDVIGTINSLIDPVVETSMMQGVKNTLETAASVARYDDNAGAGLGVLGTMAANAGLNYVSQVVPTILGQAARVIDPVRRSTDTVSPNSFVAGMEKQGRKMMNKIPFLSMLNNPYVNARGEEELNSPSANPLVSIPYQFISPGYLQEINQTEADKSARAVYNAGVPMLDEEGKPLLDENGEQVLVPQMDKGVFETWKSKVTVGEHKFTPDEMYQYRTTAGQANEAIRTALAQEEWFSNLNPQAQNDLLKSVNTLVDKLGKETVGYPQDDKALDVYKEGGIPDLLNYYKEKAVKKQVQAETGLSAQAKKTAEITDAILAGRTDEANQMIAEETQKQEALKPYEDSAEALGIKAQDYSYIKDYAGNSWSKVEPELPTLKGLGVTNYSQYAHAVKYADSNNQSVDAQWFANTTKALDTDKSGGVSQDELIDEFNNKNMSESEVMRLWGMLALGKDGAETKQVPYIITKGKNKGKWGRH